jgi:hypothetical protein
MPDFFESIVVEKHKPVFMFKLVNQNFSSFFRFFWRHNFSFRAKNQDARAKTAESG